MHLSLDTIKAHGEAFIAQLDASYHSTIRDFLNFIESKGRQTADAVALLKAQGYTVTEPTEAPAAVAAAPASDTAPAQ